MEISGTDAKSVKRVLLILWFAFVWALVMYWIVITVIHPQPAETGMLRWILLASGALTAAAALYVRVVLAGRLLSKATPLADQEWVRLRTYYIVSYALSEAVALYGVVYYFLSGSLGDSWQFIAAAFLLLLLGFPRLPA